MWHNIFNSDKNFNLNSKIQQITKDSFTIDSHFDLLLDKLEAAFMAQKFGELSLTV